MLRTSVLCCAMAGVLGLAVGCNGLTKSHEEAVTTMQTDLEKLDKKVAELKEKADKSAGDEKGRLEAKWKDAGAKRDAAKKKLDELKTAPADKWEAVKKEADAAIGEAKKAVEN
jgi:hypothetical protein